jgi:hypothetical protein
MGLDANLGYKLPHQLSLFLNIMWKRLALVDMNSPKRIMKFQYSDNALSTFLKSLTMGLPQRRKKRFEF